MEHEEHQAIYDFLYKDLIICNSLYSQFFRGLLTSTKNSTQSIEGTDKTGEASLPGIAKERQIAQYRRRIDRVVLGI